MKKKQKKLKWKWYRQVLLDIFAFVAIYGWFFAIWIPQYRWRIIFTSIVSLIIGIIQMKVKEEFFEKNDATMQQM